MRTTDLIAHLYVNINDVDRHPLPFQCRIVPRIPGMDAKAVEELIIVSSD